ncbi:MAG: M20/M25/M40 family metallo-hydrolase [Clostridia bacterium]|nr:M20/M25/M40 family metallo-hydrolase [Clostridia bacterium]
MTGIIIGASVGGVLLAFIAVVLIRALLFKPLKVEKREAEAVAVDEAQAAENLAAMVRCRTVSSRDKSLESEEEFEKFKALLPKLFPTVYSVCILEYVKDRAILLRWRGRTDKDPTVLMAHYDVVSVEEDKWEKPAFDGIIEDGVIWGRGTIDTKGSLCGALTAAQTLAKEGFQPEADVYFAFAGDEEINGHGASDIVELFVKRGISPALVLDEGGAVITNIFPGVKQPCAVIGIAEKGMLNVEYSISSDGGHSSAPKPHTPVGRLAAACVRLENHPFKFRITDPTYQMFNTLGRHSTFFYRLVFSNLWCFAPVLNFLGKKNGGQINAIARTTLAFTKMQGSQGINVIPPSATMASNSRILPGETVESAVNYIKKTVADADIEVSVINGNDPSAVSRTDVEGWHRLVGAVNATWQEALVSPYLMTACSDARHWSKISDRVYRFSAMSLSNEENAMIHGNNERIPTSTVAKTVEFYIRLIKSS